MTVHGVEPLVIVIMLPILLQPPELDTATCNPELAVAATLKLFPYAALKGAAAVIAIDWLVLFAVVMLLTCGAGL